MTGNGRLGFNYFKKAVCGTVLALGVSAGAYAASVDLTSWIAEGNGTWTVIPPNNDTVNQSINGSPTVFFTPTPSQGGQLSGTITVNTASDDDFIGFVLGYNTGDLTNPSADYILIDWNKADQMDNGCLGAVGLAVSRVNGVLGHSDAWCHQGNVSELTRGATLGSTGWVTGQTYTFKMTFTPGLIEIFVDDVLQASIPGTPANGGSFSSGGFGFYNFSQENVTYAGVMLTWMTVPVPALGTLPLLITAGLVGFAAMRRRRES